MHICRCSWRMNHDIFWQQTHQNVCFATLFPFGYCISYIFCIRMCLCINQSSFNEENSLLSMLKHNTTTTITQSQEKLWKISKMLEQIIQQGHKLQSVQQHREILYLLSLDLRRRLQDAFEVEWCYMCKVLSCRGSSSLTQCKTTPSNQY